MQYTVTATSPEDKPKLQHSKYDNLKIPAPEQSTRQYFDGKDLDKLQVDGILDVPMTVGLETWEGDIRSIYEIEKIRPSLSESQKLTFKPFVSVVGKEEVPAAANTYINGSTVAGHVGTNGERFQGADGKNYTLRWTMPEELVTTLPNGEEGTLIRSDGVLVTAIGEFKQTSLEMYFRRVDWEAIKEELSSIVYIKANQWLYLPHTKTMGDAKLLASLIGKHPTLVEYATKDDNSQDDITRYNRNMDNALLVWLSSKCQSVASHTLTSNFDIKVESITANGFGAIRTESPRMTPLHQPAKPSDYEEIAKIWRERAPLSLMLDLIMIKGFDIPNTYRKKSVLIAALVSDWGKTTLLAKAFERNNLAKTMAFSKLVNTIVETDRVGSVALDTLYKYPVIIFDEAADIITVKKEYATAAIKDIGTGNVSGGAKNQLIQYIENFSLTWMLASDEIETHVRTLSSKNDLDNRTIYPPFTDLEAKVAFEDYTEKDTLDTLTYLVYEMFYERYNKLKDMSAEGRVEFFAPLKVEDTFDREAERAAVYTLGMRVAIDAVALTIGKSKDFKLSNIDNMAHENPENYLGVDINGNVIVLSAQIKNKGLHAHLEYKMDGGSAEHRTIKFADYTGIIGKRVENRTNYTMPPDVAGGAPRHGGKAKFYVPVDRTILEMSPEGAVKALELTNPKLLKAVEDKNIVPFLQFLLDLDTCYASFTALVANLYHAWSSVDSVIPDEPKLEGDAKW